MRLFISINIEGELAEMFRKKVEELKRHSIQGRFPEPGNMHLTVVFLGETENIEAVKQAMDNMKARPFELKFRRIGKFTRQGRETYFVSLRSNSMLKSINWQLSESLRSVGFELDKREYTPHLTLGRNLVFDMDFDLEEFSKGVAEMKARMKVMKISLMKSERVEGRQEYTEIHHVDLYDE
jgi:2'-5' RNA ligase